MLAQRRLALTALLAPAALAHAQIAHVTNVQILDQAPENVTPDRLVSNVKAFVFTERVDFVLQSDLDVQLSRPGVYEPGVPLDGAPIPAGSTVSVHFFHWDFPAEQFASRTIEGAIVLEEDQMLAGVLTSNAALDASDSLFGLPGVQYPTGNFSRRIEIDPELAGLEGQDSITLSSDLGRLDFRLQLGDRWIDQMRIVTIQRPIPAPASLASLALLGALAHTRRR